MLGRVHYIFTFLFLGFIHLFIYLFIYLVIYLFIYLFIYLESSFFEYPRCIWWV